MGMSAKILRILPGSLPALALVGLLAGCSTLPRNPVPTGQTEPATIPGMPEVRAWAGRPSASLERDFELSLQQESPEVFPVEADGRIRYPHLALSGGGVNGAFGAGFLNGWSATGTRPVFKIVTGVSTGALMAPFAFLGPPYDEKLHRFYTTTTTNDVFTERSRLVALMRGDALADTAPLVSLIDRYVDAALLEKVAEAHRQGRRLYMGTVDLDSRSFVVWNMGLIAGQGGDQALALFRKVMLASSSVPVAFPPVLFEVEANGRRYDEMHVDGFVWANVFLNAGVFNPAALYARSGRAPGREDIFVVHNGQLSAPPAATARSLRGIAVRAIDISGRAGIVGDLFREYSFAMRNNADFHWITIGQDVVLPDLTAFEPSQMGSLYQAGYEAGRAGPAWRTQPPGIRDDPVPGGSSGSPVP
jgi:hypothetical protein